MHKNDKGAKIMSEENIEYKKNEIMKDMLNKSAEKEQEFKARLKAFENVTTLEEAKALAKTTLPVSQEINHFRVGNAKCVVVNRDNLFRVCVDTEEEFLSYDFM